MIGPLVMLKHWENYHINLISLSRTSDWFRKVEVVTVVMLNLF